MIGLSGWEDFDLAVAEFKAVYLKEQKLKVEGIEKNDKDYY